MWIVSKVQETTAESEGNVHGQNHVKADLHGTTLPHTTSLQQACDMS